MSFVGEVKSELARINTEKDCCRIAEIAGFIRFCGSIYIMGGEKYRIVMKTSSLATVRHYKKMINDYFRVDPLIGAVSSKSFGKGKTYTMTLDPETLSEMILREVGILMARAGRNSITDGIYDELLRTKCCRRSYIRGAFLASGTISNPEKGHHFEITTESEANARDLRRLINTFVDINPRIVERKNRYGVYIKAREQVADMLGIMGAGSSYLEYQNAIIKKDMITHAHRAENLDNANIDKSLQAAEQQVEWIRRIEESAGLSSLSPKLQEAAVMRLEHPDAGLEELGQMFDPPLSKSGINNRLRRLEQIAKGI